MIFVFGILIGLALGLLIAKRLFIAELKYKAKTGIRICEGGKFFTVKEEKDD